MSSLLLGAGGFDLCIFYGDDLVRYKVKNKSLILYHFLNKIALIPSHSSACSDRQNSLGLNTAWHNFIRCIVINFSSSWQLDCDGISKISISLEIWSRSTHHIKTWQIPSFQPDKVLAMQKRETFQNDETQAATRKERRIFKWVLWIRKIDWACSLKNNTHYKQGLFQFLFFFSEFIFILLSAGLHPFLSLLLCLSLF